MENDIREIIERKRKIKKRHDYCVLYNICPICNAELIEEKYEKFDNPKKYLFGLIQIKGKHWDRRTICSINKQHYCNQYDYGYRESTCL